MTLSIVADLKIGETSLIDAVTGRINNDLMPIGSYSTTITGDGETTTFFIGHNLESMTLVSAIYDIEGNAVDVTVTCTSLNNIVVQFGVAPEAAEEFRIVLVK